MKFFQLIVSCLLSTTVFELVHCYPTGAPSEVCTNIIYPVGHNGTSQDLTTNPFQLSLSDFDLTYGGQFYYVPGQQYTLRLSGSGGEQFRGFLVQARTVADGSPVGTFTVNGPDQILSSCTPPESAVTHYNNTLKSSVTLRWRAPSLNSSDIRFLYAVVVESTPTNSTFYATGITNVLHTCAIPLYESESECVETCPDGQFGNATSGICQSLPDGYVAALNATQYYAQISNDYPLGNPVFNIRVIISIQNFLDLFLSLSQTEQINDLFEFDGGTTEITITTDDLVQVGDKYVFDTFIALEVNPDTVFSETDYPVDLNIEISLVGLLMPNQTLSKMSLALGEIAPDPCASNPCGNGGSCEIFSTTNYTCTCTSGYTGTNCEEVADPCIALAPCINQATCQSISSSKYTCICPAGYTGTNCSDIEDSCLVFEPCINGNCTSGIGSDYSCECSAGYNGTDCDIDIDECAISYECVNGACVNEVAGYTCDCDPGFTGSLCDHEINECETANCNNGTCTDLFNDYMCNCYQDYTGQHCDEVINDCDSSPCSTLNSIRCDDSNTTFFCQCLAGFTGETCGEVVVACESNPCDNGGTCTNQPFGEFSCLCPPQFTGSICTVPVLACESDPCENGGTCSNSGTDFTCECAMGWNGTTCTEDVDECFADPCLNRGNCINIDGSYTCECGVGFSGPDCEEDLDFCLFLSYIICVNGTCVEGYGTNTSCECDNGFTGDSCDQDDTNVTFCTETRCRNSGTCLEEFGQHTNCLCAPGYTGVDCSRMICLSDTCLNGGTCNETDDGGVICYCESGYSGNNCQYNNETICDITRCLNGGTCIEREGRLMILCNCTLGYTGLSCENDDTNQTFCEEHFCANNGTCTEGFGTETHCLCQPGFTGADCMEEYPRCMDNLCSNAGTCIEEFGSNISCTCASGFTGYYCDNDDANVTFCREDLCRNGGTCEESFGDSVICNCVPGFEGDRCDTCIGDEDGYCNHGGTCYQEDQVRLCYCPPQYTGNQCAIAVCLPESDVPIFSDSSVTYNWSMTETGSSQNQSCPSVCQEFIPTPSGAMVERVCERDSGQWLETNISQCGLSITTIKLCEAYQLKDARTKAAIVLELSSVSSLLDSDGIELIGEVINNLTLAAIADPQVRQVFLGIVDNVIEANTSELLKSQIQSNSSTKILQALNSVVDAVPLDNVTLRNVGIRGRVDSITLTDAEQSFSVELGPVETAISDNTTISLDQLILTNTETSISGNSTGSLHLQSQDSCFQTLRRNERVVYSVFRTNALFLTPETTCNESAVGSIILGVRTSNDNRDCSPSSVMLDLQQLNEVCEKMVDDVEPTCAHHGEGGWSSDKCKKVGGKKGRVMCDCSQLGHFALLFDLNPRTSVSPLALAIISYIGTGLSGICLIVLIISYLNSKTLRSSEHGKILINISISLLGLYVVFVVGGLVTSVEPLCGLVAALFQYIMLVFFTWTAAEAVFLYRKLVVVLGSHIRLFVLKAAIVAWVAPLLVTALSVGLGYKHYVNPYYCRAIEWPFWLGFVLPFGIITIFNWAIFIVIMTKLVCRKIAVKVNMKEGKQENFRQNLFIAIGLSLLLGLGWGFGLTATSSDLKELTFVLQIIFSLFVGSQGVLIFVFHGLRSSHFRTVWISCFGLRSRKRAPKYNITTSLGSKFMELNTIATGTLSTETKQLWDSYKQTCEYSQVVSNTYSTLQGDTTTFECTDDPEHGGSGDSKQVSIPEIPAVNVSAVVEPDVAAVQETEKPAIELIEDDKEGKEKHQTLPTTGAASE